MRIKYLTQGYNDTSKIRCTNRESAATQTGLTSARYLLQPCRSTRAAVPVWCAFPRWSLIQVLTGVSVAPAVNVRSLDGHRSLVLAGPDVA